MENQHAKLLLDIEIRQNRQAKNNEVLQHSLAMAQAREKEVDELQEEYDQKQLLTMRKQRELDITNKKYYALKELFDVSIST